MAYIVETANLSCGPVAVACHSSSQLKKPIETDQAWLAFGSLEEAAMYWNHEMVLDCLVRGQAQEGCDLCGC